MKKMMVVMMMVICFLIGAFMGTVLSSTQETQETSQEEVSERASSHPIGVRIVLFGAKAYTMQPNTVVCKKGTSCDTTRLKF